jgi:hypothetical protein
MTWAERERSRVSKRWRPAPSIGTRTVLPSSNNCVIRFTGVPPTKKIANTIHTVETLVLRAIHSATSSIGSMTVT